jgi:hypothetical protein
MKLCVLCKDENVVEARKRVVLSLPTPTNAAVIEKIIAFKENLGIKTEPESNHLKVPCSPTGELPATHWFCFINVNDDVKQEMLKNQLYTIIEEDIVPSEFLEKHGLQRIKGISSYGSKN